MARLTSATADTRTEPARRTWNPKIPLAWAMTWASVAKPRSMVASEATTAELDTAAAKTEVLSATPVAVATADAAELRVNPNELYPDADAEADADPDSKKPSPT